MNRPSINPIQDLKSIRPNRSIYKIESVQGCGHSATVYRATREDEGGIFRQTVALKVFKSETAVSWMKREFETLARVHSQHCVRVMGWEDLSLGYALVLEWIDGVNLLELAGTVGLDAEVSGEILAQTQQGLSDLHRSGLCHGDLSPANILIDREGRVRLVDFAAPTQLEDTVTGTPAYIAPEVWQGQKPDAMSDLFSLGLLEHDLHHGFSHCPQFPDDCRRRADSIARTDASVLSVQPSQRRPNERVSQPDLQLRLAALAQAAADEKLHRNFKTRQFPISPVAPASGNCLQVLATRWVAGLAASLIATATSVQARAPEDHKLNLPLGSVRLHTQKWNLSYLNGVKIGYAPVEIRGLQPGNHRLDWVTSAGHFQAKLVLRPGETLSLSDSDLAQLLKH